MKKKIEIEEETYNQLMKAQLRNPKMSIDEVLKIALRSWLKSPYSDQVTLSPAPCSFVVDDSDGFGPKA